MFIKPTKMSIKMPPIFTKMYTTRLLLRTRALNKLINHTINKYSYKYANEQVEILILNGGTNSTIKFSVLWYRVYFLN